MNFNFPYSSKKFFFPNLISRSLNEAAITQTSSTNDDFFTGYENMAWSDPDNELLGNFQ